MTLQQAVFAGLVDPSNLVIVRQIQPVAPPAADCATGGTIGATSANCDIAVFRGPQADFTVTVNANGSVRVVDTTATPDDDGTDTLTGIEVLRFDDGFRSLVPTVTARTPADGAIGFAVAGNILATFSEAVSGVSNTTFTIKPTAGGANLASVVTRVGTSNQYQLNPNANLAPNTGYTVTLTGGPTAIRSTAGIPITTTSWTFTTGGSGDLTAPTVTARAPAFGATSVVAANNVTATFSEPVNGVSATTFTVRQGTDPAGALVAAAVTQNGTTNQWILNPDANLAADTLYTVRLTGGASSIRDVNGNALVSTSWTFTTGPAPTNTARTPAFSATSVAVANNITATFSEAVNGVSATTFTVREGTATTGALVAGVVSQNGTTNQWILNPDANLTPDTLYTVRLTGGAAAIRDLAGNPFASTSWTFRTGPAPTLTARTPGVNATGVGRNNNITATFSEPVTGVSATTVTLRNVATNALETAVVTQNGTTNQWILDPAATLAASTQYRVTLTGGAAAIRDLAGNPFVSTNWTFTTGAT